MFHALTVVPALFVFACDEPGLEDESLDAEQPFVLEDEDEDEEMLPLLAAESAPGTGVHGPKDFSDQVDVSAITYSAIHSNCAGWSTNQLELIHGVNVVTYGPSGMGSGHSHRYNLTGTNYETSGFSGGQVFSICSLGPGWIDVSLQIEGIPGVWSAVPGTTYTTFPGDYYFFIIDNHPASRKHRLKVDNASGDSYHIEASW